MAIIAAVAWLPVLFYLVFGYAGHDMELHVTSWIEVSEAWRAGMFYPGWSARANFMLGDPHFCFYPPLSFLLGGALVTLLPMHLVPGAYMWIALTLAGCAMYAAAGAFVAGRDRLTAALLYMLNPYLLTTSLVRFAAAELLVQSILPLILLAAYHAFWLGRRTWIVWLGCLLAAAWLTNIPAAIVLFYCLLPAALVRAWQRHTLAPLLRFMAAEALATGLAAFHLVPVLVEKSWISQARLVRMDPHTLLLWLHPDAPALAPMRTFIVGLWIIAAVSAGLIAGSLVGRRQPLRHDRSTQMMLIVAASAFLLETPLAAPLWTYLPQLSSVAFPYRFLPLEAAPLVLILLAPATQRRWLAPACVLLGLLALMPMAEFAIVQSRPETRTPALNVLLQRWNSIGYEGFPEFVPAGAGIPLKPPLQDNTCVTARTSAPTPRPAIKTASPEDCTVPMRILFYPLWHARLDGKADLPILRAEDGTIMMHVPAGRHIITLDFNDDSLPRRASILFSVLCLLGVAAFFYFALKTNWRGHFA